MAELPPVVEVGISGVGGVSEMVAGVEGVVAGVEGVVAVAGEDHKCAKTADAMCVAGEASIKRGERFVRNRRRLCNHRLLFATRLVRRRMPRTSALSLGASSGASLRIVSIMSSGI
jgi:hypothetical protein